MESNFHYHLKEFHPTLGLMDKGRAMLLVIFHKRCSTFGTSANWFGVNSGFH